MLLHLNYMYSVVSFCSPLFSKPPPILLSAHFQAGSAFGIFIVQMNGTSKRGNSIFFLPAYPTAETPKSHRHDSFRGGKHTFTGCPKKKTITLLIGIYFYITTSIGIHLTYTIQEINILQESAIETTSTPTLLPWLSWKLICCFFRF